MTDRHALETELLAALLFHGPEAHAVLTAHGLSYQSFTPGARDIARVLSHCILRHPVGVAWGVPDDVLLAAAATDLGLPALAGTIDLWLADVLGMLGVLENVAPHAAMLRDLLRRDEAQRHAMTLAATAADPRRPLDATLTLHATTMASLVAPPSEKASNPILDALDELEQHAARGGELPGVPFGIETLDDLTQGACPGWLIVVAAATGVGKTAFALHAAHTAADAGHDTLFISLELPAKQIQARRFGIATGLDLHRIRRDPILWNRHAPAIHDAAASLPAMSLQVVEGAETLAAIEAVIRARPTPPKMVVIDQLSWLRAVGDEKQDRHDLTIESLTRGLCRIAKGHGLCVVLIAQLNRDSTKGAKPRAPNTSDLRNSAAIENDADLVLLMHEPPFDVNDTPLAAGVGRVELNVAKNRHGPTGIVAMHFQKTTGRYRDATPRYGASR